MSLPTIIASILALSLGIISFVLYDERRKTKKLSEQTDVLRKNSDYLVNLLKEIQSNIVSGKDLEELIDTITNSLDKAFPYSTISSVFIKDQRLIFKCLVKESVSRAFVDHIKDSVVSLVSPPDNINAKVEEEIKGVNIDDLESVAIKSTFDMKFLVGEKTTAVINISSTSENLYTEEDEKTLTTLSEIVSGFITRVDLLLEAEKERSQAMIDSFSEGIFMLDRNQKITAINTSASKFLHINSQQPDLRDILSALPNTYNFKARIQEALSEKRTIEEDDIRIDGKVFKVVITPVTEANELIGASVLLHDQTVEKALSQTKEDFTNIMVHELRSPLTAIRASSEFLTSSADLSTDEKYKMIEMISESSKRMLEKISLILDSAKMDAGLFAIRKTESDLKKLINDRISAFSSVAIEKKINIKLDIDPTIPNFLFDPIRIDEVINNLLSNSLKFTPANGTISIKAHQTPGKVTVSVKDTGEGIPKDKQHLLFAKFQQAPSDGEHQGTGLGLYVVKGVVEAHGGTVWLESEVGVGTTISFTLPVEEVAKPTGITNPHPSSEQRMVN